MDSVYVLHKPKVPAALPTGVQEPHYYGNGHVAAERIIASGNVDVSSVLSELFTSIGENFTMSRTSRSTELLHSYNSTLAIECCSKRITRMLQSIFSGHRHIHAALKKGHYEGRWIVQIHRCFHDKALIDEVCTLVSTIPARQIADEGIHSKGIFIAPVHDGEKWREHTVGNYTETEQDLDSNDVRKPCSMMMNGNVSLYVEGPWFYLYEEIETMLDALESDHQDNQCRLLAVDVSEFSDNMRNVQHRLEELMYHRKLPYLAGILCLYRGGWSTQEGAITAELLHNPSGKATLPQSFIDTLHSRYTMIS